MTVFSQKESWQQEHFIKIKMYLYLCVKHAHTNTNIAAAAHPAMLLMERLLERLLPWKPMMVVGLREDGRVKEEWSSGDRMADHGRSLVPPAKRQKVGSNDTKTT